MKKLAILLIVATVIATGCKKLPEFTSGNGSSGGGDTPTVVTPTVTTVEATEITETFAMLNGVITNYDANYTYETGFYFGTTETLDSFISADDFGHGAFGTKFAGLTANTTYYYKAYAIISGGGDENAGYGEVMSFTTAGGGSGNAPEGAINGLFTINSNGDQVYFSKGNLQYQASTNTWRFAENQLDYLGEGNSNISETYDGWIDLFGWGTSGYDHGAVCYQPWSTSTNSLNYYAYGNETYNLNDQTGQADWGYNAIINGGNAENLWRTLTSDEWNYVFNTRNTTSGIRYAKAKINSISGIIILPDDWNTSYYTLNNTNSAAADFTSNLITDSDWANCFETHGVVFLPQAGSRQGTSYMGDGLYWSSNHSNNNYAYCVYFNNHTMNAIYTYDRLYGFAVRLVHNAGN